MAKRSAKRAMAAIEALDKGFDPITTGATPAGEVEVDGQVHSVPAEPGRTRPGPLAGLPEGAISAALIGSVFGGPIGALIGGGVGILHRRLEQGKLDDAAAEAAAGRALDEQI